MATTNLIFGGEWAGRLEPGQAMVWSNGTLTAAGTDVSVSVLSQADRTLSSSVYSLELSSFSVVTGPAGLNLNWVTTNNGVEVIEGIRFTYCVTA